MPYTLRIGAGSESQKNLSVGWANGICLETFNPAGRTQRRHLSVGSAGSKHEQWILPYSITSRDDGYLLPSDLSRR